MEIKTFPSSLSGHRVFVLQSPHARAINVGYIRQQNTHLQFIPGRLNLGMTRAEDTYRATRETLANAPIQTILRAYKPGRISTITVLRETLACQLGPALHSFGIIDHYGDAFIGATHIKDNGPIRTAYQYENIEGLVEGGLWIIADSICMGRNLAATLTSLLPKIKPKEVLLLAPLASRRGIEIVDAVLTKYTVPTTYIAWGALFGVDEKTLYDMPWGHNDTEALDVRDQKLFVSMYGPKLCVGGDFGNDYYCPHLALSLYDAQLQEHHVTPKIPTAGEVLRIYRKSELVIRES